MNGDAGKFYRYLAWRLQLDLERAGYDFDVRTK